MRFDVYIRPFFISFLIASLCIAEADADQWPHAGGARSLALGGSALCLQDVWAVQNNQAALGFFNQRSWGIAFENRYGLKELSRVSLVGNMPINNWNLAINLNQLGSGAYSEVKHGLGMGKRFGQDWSAGIGLHYHSLRYADRFYPGKQGLSMELGALFQPQEHFQVAFHGMYGGGRRLESEAYSWIQSSVRAGLRYRVHHPLWISSEMALYPSYRSGLRLGLEYELKSVMYVRGGYSINPDQFSFGIGWNHKQLRADMAFLFHPVLGFTPSVSLWHAF